MPSAGKLTDKDSGMIGSYEEWCWTVGGILKSAGINGFLGNLEQLRNTADTDHGAWVEFCKEWSRLHYDRGVKAGEIREIFEQEEELAALLGNGNEAARATRLGHLLKKRVGVVFGDLRIDRTSYKSGGAHLFRVVENLTKNEKPNQNLTIDSQVQNGEVCEVCEVFSDPLTHVCAHAHERAHAQGQNLPKPHKPNQPGGDSNLNGVVRFSKPGEEPEEIEI